MLRIDFPLEHHVDIVRQVKLEPSSYTSADGHTPSLPPDLTVTPPTIIQELRPETTSPTKHTTTPSTQQTFPGSYTETQVKSQNAPIIEVPSSAANIQDYLEGSVNKLEAEWDSVPTNPVASTSSPPGDTSTCTPSAPKSYKTTCFDKVPETLKLDYSW